MKPAFQVCQRTRQDGRAVARFLKDCPDLLRVLMVFFGARVVFRNRLLIAAQDVDPETLSSFQPSMRASSLIHANQHQHRVQRHRAERIRRHPVNFTVFIHGDDRDAGGETSHGLAKIDRV